jgi:hypothetical protein
VPSPKEVLETQLDELQTLLHAAGFRQPSKERDKRRARRLADALRTAPTNASAVRLMIADPESSRALLAEVQALNQALEGIMHWAGPVPDALDREMLGSRFGVVLAVLLQWTI